MCDGNCKQLCGVTLIEHVYAERIKTWPRKTDLSAETIAEPWVFGSQAARRKATKKRRTMWIWAINAADFTKHAALL